MSGYGYGDVSTRLDALKLPQAIVYREHPRHGWQAFLALPSLHPAATVKGAILYATEAVDVETREPHNIKILGTGEYR